MRLALALLPLLAGCAATELPERTPAAQARLASALEGLTPGEPQRCISRTRQYNLDIVDRSTILFRSGRNLSYRADFPGGCGALGPSSTIAYRTTTGEICQGDIVRVIDRVTASPIGSCAFPRFVPYIRQSSSADRQGP